MDSQSQGIQEGKKLVQVTNYLLFLPQGYDQKAEKKWPLIMFLHGSGERGGDVNKVKAHGPPKIAEQKKDFPFIVVSPQCPTDQYWSTSTLNNLLNEVISQYKVDDKRIYLTGLSMGGYGTWDMAIEFPNRFAAIAPVCGGGDPSKVCTIRRIPVWVFHGAKDDIVPLQKSEEMVDALKKAGGDAKFTVYPDAGHDSWSLTYDNPELYGWFLSFTRQDRIVVPLSEQIITAYPGDYKLANGEVINLIQEGSKLYGVWKLKKFELSPLNETTFFIAGSDTEITFFKKDQKVKYMVLRECNDEKVANKVDYR